MGGLGEILLTLGAVVLGYFAGKQVHDCPPPPTPPAWSTMPTQTVKPVPVYRPAADPDATREMLRIR
jgi:hypothetical protein